MGDWFIIRKKKTSLRSSNVHNGQKKLYERQNDVVCLLGIDPLSTWIQFYIITIQTSYETFTAHLTPVTIILFPAAFREQPVETSIALFQALQYNPSYQSRIPGRHNRAYCDWNTLDKFTFMVHDNWS